MKLTNMFKKNNSNQGNEQKAKIRVGGRGGAYIPSEELAALPEVRMMQEMASLIVSKKMTTSRN